MRVIFYRVRLQNTKALLKQILGNPDGAVIYACYSDGTEQPVDGAEGESGIEEWRLSTKLLHFYDEFSEFNDCCAFLCDAYACLPSIEGGLDENSVVGLKRSTEWIKAQLNRLKQELSNIQTSAMKQQTGHN